MKIYPKANLAVSPQTAYAVIVALAPVITELTLLFLDRVELLIVQTSKFDNPETDSDWKNFKRRHQKSHLLCPDLSDKMLRQSTELNK